MRLAWNMTLARFGLINICSLILISQSFRHTTFCSQKFTFYCQKIFYLYFFSLFEVDFFFFWDKFLPRLSWNSLCSQGWSWTHNSSSSASQMLPCTQLFSRHCFYWFPSLSYMFHRRKKTWYCMPIIPDSRKLRQKFQAGQSCTERRGWEGGII